MKFNYRHINKFEVEIDFSVEKDLKSFKEETLEHISNVTKGKDIILIFSGGNDSRFIARILMELNLPFKAITNSFSADFSDYDSIVSHQFCVANNIEHERRFLNRRIFFERVKELAHYRGYIYPSLICYYIQYLVEQEKDSGFKGVFLTGCGSEFKIDHQENNSYIFMRPHPYLLSDKNIGTLYNFTTSRTFLSYIREKEFLSNYKTSKDGFDIRDNIYKKCYPDLRLEKKTFPNDELFLDYFAKKIVPFLYHYDVYKFILEKYEFNIDEYLK